VVNLDIITGFLGAGKTTLINRLLAEAYIGEKPVLIENEFGKVSIDDSLIEDKEVQVRLLTSGCICCTLKGDFVEGIIQVVEQYSPSRIVIEPTGLAVPSDILSICEDAGKKVPVRVNSFLTLANAKNLLRILNAPIELFRKQISEAGILVLNRTKLLSPDELKETMDAIRILNPHCTILDQDHQNLDALSILTLAEDVIKPCVSHNCQHEHDHTHNVEGIENISSLAFFPGKLFSLKEMTGLFTAFSEGHCGQILRAKGFLKTDDGYAHLEYVYGQGELLDTTYDSLSKFVVIGIGLDKNALSQLLGGSDIG